MKETKKLLLIDAHALIHRMFHALPGLTNGRGEPTGALYGVTSTLFKILKRDSYDYVAAAFDCDAPTFRSGLSEIYKAHRPELDDRLVPQLESAKRVFEAFGIPVVELPGFEGDDILGTLAERFKKKALVTILTGDLDALQLVEDGRVVVRTFRKGVNDVVDYDEAAVEERFGVPPKALIDWKALVGDQSDNIKGVNGIGAVGATKLLKEYGTLEKILKSKATGTAEEKVRSQKEAALLSKTLATIRRDVELPIELPDLAWRGFENGKLYALCMDLEFRSLIEREKLSPAQGLFEAATEEKPKKQKSPRKKKTRNIVAVADDSAFSETKSARDAIKVAHDWKNIWKKLAETGKAPAIDGTYFDTLLAAWLLQPGQKDYPWSLIAMQYLRREETEPTEESLEEAYEILHEKLKAEKLLKLLETVEMPLVEVLGDMERGGIRVNPKKLEEMKSALEKEIRAMSGEIFALAGEEFNINSPREIGRILFEKLGLGGKKKTKTGQISTKEDVLASLLGKHPVVSLLLGYRENAKILGTYVEPLLALSRKSKGLIQTTFLQTGTATGRIASEKPNLQNLPQGSRWSKGLREAFEAEKGRSFVSFDYSQLELRIIAHVSKDEALLTAFREGRDIHTATAQKIFHAETVSPEKRRVAKTLNFGLAYGMGARAFAQEAGMTVEDAKRYIAEYFAEFPGVRKWQEEEKARVKELGYVENENGRKRWFSDAKNFFEIERAAINMPIQSLEADIVKIAMRKAYETIHAKNYAARIALTIHDELIFEVSDDILEPFMGDMKRVLENSYALTVPLTVDAKVGKTLGAMEYREL